MINITSEMTFLKPPMKANCSYKAFFIENGTVKTGVLDWSPNTNMGTKKGNESPIILTAIYPIQWREYSKIDDRNGGTFMYIVNTMKMVNTIKNS